MSVSAELMFSCLNKHLLTDLNEKLRYILYCHKNFDVNGINERLAIILSLNILKGKTNAPLRKKILNINTTQISSLYGDVNIADKKKFKKIKQGEKYTKTKQNWPKQ